jgi:hypothetical protein
MAEPLPLKAIKMDVSTGAILQEQMRKEQCSQLSQGGTKSSKERIDAPIKKPMTLKIL